MKFVDEVVIDAAAGDGGAGSIHWRREKFVPMGGPDGGNGGRGGSVFVIGDSGINTLLDFRFQPRWHAKSGESGGGNNRNGKSGTDLELRVPLGTQVYDAESEELLADVISSDEKICVLKGGRGGKGNAFFKKATLQAPDFAQPGELGERRQLRLNLKVLADVGIVGLPNAGKSTFISRVSAAKPKIADYPFTTLTPQLGMVRVDEGKSFVVADIPGLIEGAHTGKGLGVTFLKHLERTKLLLHFIDATGPLEHLNTPEGLLTAYRTIRNEIDSFSPELAEKPEIIVLTKVDSSTNVNEAILLFKKFHLTSHCISSVTGTGINDLLRYVIDQIEEIARL